MMKATYPELRTPSDPFSDDHWLRAGDGFDDYRRHGGTLPHPAYLESRRAVLADATPERLAELLLDIPPRPQCHAPLAVPWVMKPTDLVRIGCDIEPALGADAPDLVLGPWSDLPCPRSWLQMATAELVFAHLTGEPRSTRDRWKRRVPLPPIPDRMAVQGIALAPLTVFRVLRRTDEAFEVEERMGISPKRVPVRLRVPTLVSVDGGADTLVARAVWTGVEWVAAIAFGLAGVPSDDWLSDAFRSEWLHARLLDRKVARDQVLRTRGFVLLRKLHERAFLAQS